jgi:hypothetical protein
MRHMAFGDKTDRTTVTIAGSILLLFLSFGAFLWKADLFRFDGSDASAKVVSATLALAGAFGASLFALIGVMLKHAIDVRTEERLRLESDRNDVSRRECSCRHENQCDTFDRTYDYCRIK